MLNFYSWQYIMLIAIGNGWCQTEYYYRGLWGSQDKQVSQGTRVCQALKAARYLYLNVFSTSVTAAVFPFEHDFTQYCLTVIREPVLSNEET